MLRIHDVMLEVIRKMRPLIVAIERHDMPLAKQLKSSRSSVTLNIAEGGGSYGGTRRERYRTALGSLLTAEASGYIDSVPADIVAGLNQVIGTLVRVTE